MKIYRPKRVQRLFVAKTYLIGPVGDAKINLLVDTGATFTMIDAQILQRVGYDPSSSTDRTEVITANGRVTVPRIRVAQLHALGQRANDLSVLAHFFSQDSYFDGLLGMNFLDQFPLEIKPYTGEIVFRGN